MTENVAAILKIMKWHRLKLECLTRHVRDLPSEPVRSLEPFTLPHNNEAESSRERCHTLRLDREIENQACISKRSDPKLTPCFNGGGLKFVQPLRPTNKIIVVHGANVSSLVSPVDGNHCSWKLGVATYVHNVMFGELSSSGSLKLVLVDVVQC